jgi:hypothetical protein
MSPEIPHPSPKRQARPPEEARAFWTGPRLSPYEELSLRSVAATGARVILHSNDMSLSVPDGIELQPVEEVFSTEIHAYAYQDGDICLTPHSDLFRYVAVERFGGWYFDLDIVCLRDRLPDAKVYLARETEKCLNAAVMKFPKAAPFLAAARDEAIRLWPEAGRLTIGPELVTRLAAQYALDHLIQPRTKAYEIGYHEILAMFDPEAREQLEDRVVDSDFVHLWNEVWRRIRIPKNFGPPEGSFLDGLFRRFDMRFTAEARLPIEALRTWQRERDLLATLAARPGSGAAGSTLGPSSSRAAPSSTRPVAKTPQTVRTFWYGGPIGPCQLMALKSFADRGHAVEVFTFDSGADLPRWLRHRDAGEIVPAGQMVRYVPEADRFAIHASLFRYALLHRLGGWWIDPDVVLLATDLPDCGAFVAGPNEFGLLSTAAMKLPAGHAILAEALDRIASAELLDWEETGELLLTRLVGNPSLVPLANPTLISPVSWYDVLDLFDPAQADEVARRCGAGPFLDLHHDAWLRAGVPNFLGPPRGSFLDYLFRRHDTGIRFGGTMELGDVRRWIVHMHDSKRLGEELVMDSPMSPH